MFDKKSDCLDALMVVKHRKHDGHSITELQILLCPPVTAGGAKDDVFEKTAKLLDSG